METCYSQQLADRSLIDICGDDAQAFLQGIVTCNVDIIEKNKAGFGALLSPQGKILFDFFIIAKAEKYVLDVPACTRDDLIKRLMFYRLRAKVEIKPAEQNINVYAVWGGPACELAEDETIIIDPRHSGMGWRVYSVTAPNYEIGNYHAHRINIGMPEGGQDFEYGGNFPHETLMDQTGGIDFKKGCYVGQEVVSRMQHRGTARKRFVHVRGSSALPPTGTPIRADEKPIGELTSIDGQNGLALVRIDRAAKASAASHKFFADENEVSLDLQSWVNFSWPQEQIEA